MDVFSVVEDRCTKCGICAGICPTAVIRWKQGIFPETRADRAEMCIRCGHCMVYCPFDAARVQGLPEERMARLEGATMPTAGSFETLCLSRRSIRRFTGTSVPKESILRILDTTRYAPSAKNSQPVRWIVVYERARMVEIGNLMVQQYREWIAAGEPLPLAEAKVLSSAWKMGEDPIFRGAPHLLLAVAPAEWAWSRVDAAIALTYMELAAHAHGVGACWAGYVTYAADSYQPLRSYLGVAEDEMVCGGQMFGYSVLHGKKAPPRKDLRLDWME